MKQAQLPDGRLVEFPDDVTPEQMTEALNRDFGPQFQAAPAPAAVPEPRDTTLGEKAAGIGLALGSGAMRATKGVVDLADVLVPKPLEPYVTDPWIDFFQRGIDSAQALKPEAFKAKQEQSFLKKDAEGNIEGLQLPSIEHASNLVAETLPMIPFLLAGGGGTAKALNALAPRAGKLAKDALGYGTANAALIAPGQWEDTYREAIETGATPEQAEKSANFAGAYTTLLTFATGTAGGGIAAKLGTESGNLASALAKGFMAEAPFEGLEEGMQSIIADVALGKDPDFVSALDQTLSAGMLGGAPGSAIAGVQHVGARNAPSTDTPAAPDETLDLRQELNDRIDEARQTIAGQSPVLQEVDRQAAERQRETQPVDVTPPEVQAPEATVPQPDSRIVPEVQEETRTEPEPEPEIPVHALITPPDRALPELDEPTPPAPEEFDATKATDEERIAFQEIAKAEGVTGPAENYVHRAYKKGNMFQAVERADGTWKVRSKPHHKANWSEWTEQETVSTDGLQPLSNKSGTIRIPKDGTYKIGEPDTTERVDHGPPDLLQDLAAGPKINRAAFEAEFGLDPADTKGVQPIPGKFDGVFTDEGGLRPDDLLEWMQESGEYINQSDEATINDAYAILEKALGGERVVARSRDVEEGAFQDAVRYAEEQAQAESEGTVEENTDATLAGYENDPGISDEEAAVLADERYEREVANVIEETAPENVSQGAAVQARPTSKTTADATPEPTPREQTPEPRPGADLDLEQPAQPEPEPEKPKTGLAHDVIEQERLARGKEPLLSEAEKTNPETMEDAAAELRKNPDRADEIVTDLLSGNAETINAVDSAVLLIHKVKVMNERTRQAKRASDEKLNDNQRLVAQGKWRELEVEVDQIERAARIAGTHAGRNLQFRKAMLHEDFTLARMEEKARAVRMRPLTTEEAATIKKQAKEIADLQERLEDAQQRARDAEAKAGSKVVYDQLATKFADRRTPKDHRAWLDSLNKQADVSRAWLKSNLSGTANAGLNPVAVFHVVRIGAAHFANGAVKLADWIAAMKKDLGSKVWSDLEGEAEALYYESKNEAESSAVESDQPLPTTQEMFYKPTTIETLVFDAAADAAAGLDLTHKTVYELAQAHIQSGVHGENAVMAAVHKDLEPFFPGLTERDVRRAFSEYGKATFPSKDAIKKELRELRSLVRMQESIDRLNKRLAPLKTGLQRDKATKKVRDKQRQLNALMAEREATLQGSSPERLASVNDARLTRLKNQIQDLQEEIDTGQKKAKKTSVEPTPEVIEAMKMRDALKEKLRQIEEAKNPPPTPEEKYQASRGKQLRRQVAELRARLKAKDYARRPRPVPPALNKENQELAHQLHKAKGDFVIAQYKWELDQASKIRKGFRFIGRLLNFSRSVKTSFDLSGFGRQAGLAIAAHPKLLASKVMAAQIKALKSEAAAHAVNQEIFNHPRTPFAEKAGLFLNKQDASKPNQREEVFMDEWVKKTPGVAFSARAYATGLNAVRIAYFNHLVDTLGRGGQVTEEEAKHIAYVVNRFTGRGSLAQFGDTGGTTVFFAPRWVQSRFAVLSGYPIYGAPSRRLKKLIFKEYLRSSTGLITLSAMIAGAFAATGDDESDTSISLDPLSTDYLKVKVGNTRIDLTAALSSPIVFLNRILRGKKTSQKGEEVSLWNPNYGGDSVPAVMGRFVRSKLAPPIAAAINLLSGTNVVGEESTVIGEVAGLVTPLSMSDAIDAMEDQGIPRGTAITILAIMGAASNTYDVNDKRKRAPRRKARVRRERIKRTR